MELAPVVGNGQGMKWAMAGSNELRLNEPHAHHTRRRLPYSASQRMLLLQSSHSFEGYLHSSEGYLRATCCGTSVEPAGCDITFTCTFGRGQAQRTEHCASCGVCHSCVLMMMCVASVLLSLISRDMQS